MNLSRVPRDQMEALVAELKLVLRKRLWSWKLSTLELPILDGLIGESARTGKRAEDLQSALDRGLQQLEPQSADALRHLFGLHNKGNLTLTRLRVDAAARMGYQSDYFRKRIEPRILLDLALAMLASGPKLEGDVFRASDKLRGVELGSGLPVLSGREQRLGVSDDAIVFENQAEAFNQVRAYVLGERPTRALLVEYSTFTIQPLLADLRDVGARIRLLMCHPDEAYSGWQSDRVENSIRNLTDVLFVGYSRILTRLYRTPASIRGRLLVRGRPDHGLVIVGWYTYRSDDAGVGVWGHDNPVIIAGTKSPAGRVLADFIKNAHAQLWNHSTTVPIEDWQQASVPPWP